MRFKALRSLGVITALACITCLGATATPMAEEAHHALGDVLDQRKPVPLLAMMAQHQKENMRAHLVAVQQIVEALGHDDFDAITAAAGRIGYSDTMAQMCTHMGAGAPGFTDTALNFHRTADTIGEAARRRDRGAVLTALNNTLQTCTGCHATYRQEVVDEATWQRLTNGVPASHPHENQQ
ncbi:MAG: cytochrome c [Deltaproteobacteria bacterium]|nr:cytochrome c [Deltaproteobacteria bacterium]